MLYAEILSHNALCRFFVVPNCVNDQFFKGKKIKRSTSQAKHRLFIGNVPRSWGVEDLRKIVSEVGPRVIGVELVKVYTFLLCYAFHFHIKL